MHAYVVDWLNLLARWLHVVAGVAWIGASFYFIWLDNHLRPPRDAADARRGASGELWAVHGGGFYRNQKFPAGPRDEPLPADLHWFKWEAYTTWLSGMALIAIVYWAGANAYLIDRAVMPLSPGAAIAISAGSILGGWLAYDALCRLAGKNETLLAVLLFGFIVLCAWALSQMFSARAAYLHVGAIMGTMMVGNVLMVIIPGQRRMIAQIRAGEEPDPEPGRRGKTRSTHNTYLTLPVLFTMTSGHYPMTYGHRHGWLVLAVIALAGVLIRQFFVQRHKGRGVPALPAIALAMLVALAVALAPDAGVVRDRPGGLADGGTRAADAGPARPPGATDAAGFAQVRAIVRERCASCHAAKPTDPAFPSPPNGVVIETPQQISALAARIHQRAAVDRTMPLANLTGMTDAERGLVAQWYARGAPVD